MKRFLVTALCTALAAPALSLAQDSVSKTPCLPGDALNPWADGTAALGSEQCRAYVVDMAPLVTSCGNRFGIAPIIKTSKSGSAFFTSLISSQAISRKIVDAPTTPVPDYEFWMAPGVGVNPDPTKNDPGLPVVVLGDTKQFGVGFTEFGTTDTGFSYDAIIGGVVNLKKADPSRLYVTRVNAAVNGCSPSSNLSQPAMGSVDSNGTVHFRADDFGAAAACGVPFLVDDNIFRVRSLSRDCNRLNVISNGYPGALFDTPATDWLVHNSATAFNTPGLLPASIGGTPPLYLGTNLATGYARGPAFPPTIDMSHLAGGATDHRGNLSFTSDRCPIISGAASVGMCGILAKSPAGGGITDSMNIWGIAATGAVTGKVLLTLPPAIVDNNDGFSSAVLGAQGEFDHYHSQVAFRGGNGQISIGTDQAGNLLAAAVVYWPGLGLAPDWPLNYIAVAKVDCATGATSWTMAGWNDGAAGKEIVDCAGGVVGRMVPLFAVTGGAPLGPSISAPMIDEAGNIWFLASCELYKPLGTDFDTCLLRAIYDPATFSYALELVLEVGDVFPGMNSTVPWRVNFLGIADSNSVASNTAWSQNISDDAHLGMDNSALDPADPQNLGGLVLGAEIVYDWNGDGTFEKCTGAGGGAIDQDYNVLLYIGALDPMLPTCAGGGFLCGDANCDGTIDSFDIAAFTLCLTNPGLYATTYPGCDSACTCDTDCNGAVDSFDIAGFVAALTGAGCPNPCP